MSRPYYKLQETAGGLEVPNNRPFEEYPEDQPPPLLHRLGATASVCQATSFSSSRGRHTYNGLQLFFWPFGPPNFAPSVNPSQQAGFETPLLDSVCTAFGPSFMIISMDPSQFRWTPLISLLFWYLSIMSLRSMRLKPCRIVQDSQPDTRRWQAEGLSAGKGTQGTKPASSPRLVPVTVD